MATRLKSPPKPRAKSVKTMAKRAAKTIRKRGSK